MNHKHGAEVRLTALARIVGRELQHLETTNQRLFPHDFTLDDIAALETNEDLAERVEAFIGRFSRLQDTLGDKLIPALLAYLGDRPASLLDNLDRAERLGWIGKADRWMELRDLRNKMIHEYMEDPFILVDALNAGHAFVPELTNTTHRMVQEIKTRFMPGAHEVER